ncbi:amino acid adenylation domain-containing protein [Streptomyces sp. ASQP_92]|uniref:amino acid adenylation domain-containing protein n=1 Tax=Streptomyces sp. ASQP_92 TaxID=2979116 RepID=UPI0021BF3E7E|nr:amino acid adenylation domain-containing protein [Streptomyces sp. ASQP_92]MCT9087694.1 amino acid adenylation domain-containing protein [Streptomyces sp. ASQP_92]
MTVLLEPTTGTHHRFVRGATMHGLFQDAARRFPEAIAVSHRGSGVSYRELDAASDGYAALLQAHGVRRGHLVPVLMERGTPLIAVLIALFKCGAAYSFLDARWPVDRLEAVIGQLGAPLLVTGVEGDWPVPVWTPPAEDLAVTAARGLAPAPVAVDGADACSVFFTSGSTGTPKGVVSSHENVVRLFDGDDFYAELGPGTVMPQTAPPTWDGFALDCWSMLLTGGRTVLLDETVLVPRTLRALIAEEGVNAAFMTTQLFNMLVTTDVGAFAGMKWLSIGGERAAPTRVRAFLAEHPGIRLLNVYGPVECGAVVTGHPVRPEDCDDPAGIPLGRALAHTDVYVLDGTRGCAPGETGELCLGGPGLALGYLGNPDLTAEVFVTVEIEGRPQRLYRTGDLGHRSAAGVFHYTGRGDRQIKIRGHRIEPAEVERTVERVATVTGAAVVPMPKPDGSYHGLALFYTRSEDGTGPEALRERLVALLPEYLVPRRVHLLDQFPQLANGKIDRRALAAQIRPEHDRSEAAQESFEGTAALVADGFASVLDLDRVPGDVSFFELGGSSLEAARLCQHLDAVLGAAVQPSQIFRTPSVRRLAAWLDATARSARAADAPVPGLAPGEILLPPEQSGFLFAAAHDKDGLGGLCRMTWWIEGPLDLDALAAAAGDVHGRHQALHARYLIRDNEIGYAVVPDRPAGAEVLRLSDAPDEGAAVTAWLAAAFTPLAVREARVWRCAAVRAKDTGRTLFGLVAHHVAFDGASETVLARDLSLAYAARRAGRAPAFPAPAPTLAEVSADHRRVISRVDLAAQAEYWEDHLELQEPLELPGRADNDLNAGPGYSPALTVTRAELARWDERARTLGTTRFALLAAQFGLVLRELTGQQDIAVKVPVARRGSEVLAGAVTCRVDLLFLRFWPPHKDDGSGLLEQAVSHVDEALAAQETGGARLARTVVLTGGGESLRPMPSFLMQDDPDPRLELAHCTAQLSRIGAPTMFTELELDVRTTADGALITASVRTDRIPAEIADRVVTAYTEGLRRGPGAPAEAPAASLTSKDTSCVY